MHLNDNVLNRTVTIKHLFSEFVFIYFFSLWHKEWGSDSDCKGASHLSNLAWEYIWFKNERKGDGRIAPIHECGKMTDDIIEIDHLFSLLLIFSFSFGCHLDDKLVGRLLTNWRKNRLISIVIQHYFWSLFVDL